MMDERQEAAIVRISALEKKLQLRPNKKKEQADKGELGGNGRGCQF